MPPSRTSGNKCFSLKHSNRFLISDYFMLQSKPAKQSEQRVCFSERSSQFSMGLHAGAGAAGGRAED